MARRAGLLIGLVAGTIAAAGLARGVLLVVRVDGDSMTPSYQPGDAVLAARRMVTGPLRPGDVVLVRLPPRLAGPPGYIIKRVTSVASGQVTVHGDGPGSYDSRAFGPLPVKCVRALVVTRLTLPERRRH